MPKQTYTIDQGVERLGIMPGQTVSYDAALPTIDDGMAFFISQLAYLEARIYEAKYPNIEFRDLVPVGADVPEWADRWDYISYDGVTMGKFITGASDDLPSVALNATKSSVPIGYAGNSFEYSLDELRKTTQMRMPIDVTMARLARRGAEEHMQRVAYFGDAERGMTGLFNNPNLAVENGTLDWLAPTTQPLQIVEDVNKLLTAVWTQSKGVHHANTLVLPASLYSYITTTYASKEYPDKSIYDLIREKNIYTARTGRPLMIAGRFQLEAAELAKHGITVPGTGRIMAYEFDAENLSMQIPMPWRPAAPQPHNLKIKVPAEYKMSGVEFRYPLAGRYRDLG